MDELLTGPQAAELCGVDPSTIRQWKRRGMLQPAGLDERNRPLYRQLDVARAERATRNRAGRTFGHQAA
jgi:DNA-binding transcriptional MerR regulator